MNEKEKLLVVLETLVDGRKSELGAEAVRAVKEHAEALVEEFCDIAGDDISEPALRIHLGSAISRLICKEEDSAELDAERAGEILDMMSEMAVALR